MSSTLHSILSFIVMLSMILLTIFLDVDYQSYLDSISKVMHFFVHQIIRQILEAHASMLTLSSMDARLTYIRNWQGLADFGISYYIVRFNKQRKDVSGYDAMVD